MVRVIDEKLVLEKLGRGEHVVILDVSDDEVYERVHLTRAIHLRRGLLPSQAGRYLPNHGSEVVLVESRGDRRALLEAADELQALGYGNLWILPEGLSQWRAHGLATQTHVHPNPAALENPTVPTIQGHASQAPF
jgi:rhodanese-related sulfurtransferase